MYIVNEYGISFFSYKDENIGQGKNKTSIYLQENPDVCKEIEEILQNKNLPTTGEVNGIIKESNVPRIESTV